MTPTPRDQRAARLGLLQVCGAGVLWGLGGLVVQVIREHAPLSVLTISAWRMGIAAAVLVATVLATRVVADVRAALRDRPGTAAFVGTCTAAYQALYFWAVTNVGVTVATVVSLGLAPVLLTLWEAARTRRAPSRTRVVVLLVALTGLVLVSGAAGVHLTGPHPWLGVAAAVASGSAYAVATHVGRPLARTTSPLVLTTLTTTVGAVALAPLALLGGGPFLDSSPVVLLALLFLGVMTMALAYALLYAGLRTTDPGAAVIATLLEPVTAGIVAAIVLGERIGALGVAGMALILAAVAGLGERADGRER